MRRRGFLASLAGIAVASAVQCFGVTCAPIKLKTYADLLYDAWDTEDREKYRVLMSAAYKPFKVTTGSWPMGKSQRESLLEKR